MTEHCEHEFTVLFDNIDGRLFAYCGVGSCPEEIECDEIERRLNDYERLKRATDALVRKLKFVYKAIETVDIDAFGIASNGDGVSWPIRDELLASIASVLHKATRTNT